MPLTPGEDVGTAIAELQAGKQFRRTRKRLGTKRAQRQAVAIALRNRRKGKRSHKRSHKSSRR
jgi:hypothetical protein